LNDKNGSECDTNVSAEAPQHAIRKMRMIVRKNYWFDIELAGHGKKKDFFFIQHQDLESTLSECAINKVP